MCSGEPIGRTGIYALDVALRWRGDGERSALGRLIVAAVVVSLPGLAFAAFGLGPMLGLVAAVGTAVAGLVAPGSLDPRGHGELLATVMPAMSIRLKCPEAAARHSRWQCFGESDLPGPDPPIVGRCIAYF